MSAKYDDSDSLPPSPYTSEDCENTKASKLQATLHQAGEVTSLLADEVEKIDAKQTLKDLSADIHRITTSFVKIGIQLGILDMEDYRKQDGEPIEKFRPQWDAIHKLFVAKIWESREIAADGACDAMSFREVLIPTLLDDNIPLSSRQAELSSFIEDLDITRNAALGMAKAFQDIPNQIKEVKTRVDLALRSVGVTYERNIASVVREIEALGEGVESILGPLAICIPLAVETAEHGNGGAEVLLKLVGIASRHPILAGIAAVGGVAIVAMCGTKIYRMRQERLSKLRQLQDELDHLQSDGVTFSGVRGNVAIALEDCKDLCDRLLAISSVWASIRTDCQVISKNMRRATKSRAFEKYLRLADEAYRKLEQILTLYANDVVPKGFSA